LHQENSIKVLLLNLLLLLLFRFERNLILPSENEIYKNSLEVVGIWLKLTLRFKSFTIGKFLKLKFFQN